MLESFEKSFDFAKYAEYYIKYIDSDSVERYKNFFKEVHGDAL